MTLDIKPHLRTYLLTSTELTNLVGFNIYADEIDEETTWPFLFFRRQGSGIIDQFDVRDQARFQFIAEAETPEEATAVWLALNTALHRKQNYQANGVTIRHSMMSSGPVSSQNTVSGKHQVLAYYIVRY